MTFTLRWTVNPRVSCLHAADAVRRGWPLSDAGLANVLAEPVRALETACQAGGVSSDAFWHAIVPLAGTCEDARDLVEKTLAAMGAPASDSSIAATLARHVEQIERSVSDYWPDLQEQVRLRERPIREQWESRGPGFLRRLAQIGGFDFGSREMEIALVQPCMGGGGEVHAEYDFVRLEAVLTNAHSELPEPVRLGWLLAQVAAAHDRGGRLVALAMLPLVLEAAEYVEWARCDEATLALAWTAWRVPLPAVTTAREMVAFLQSWRLTHEGRPIDWRRVSEEPA